MVYGIIIAGIVALSFLVIMSFADFLRFNLDPLGQHEDHELMDALDRVGMRRDIQARSLVAGGGEEGLPRAGFLGAAAGGGE